MFVVIDGENDNTLRDVYEFLAERDIKAKYFNSLKETQAYLQLSKLENHDFLIHGSLGQTKMRFENKGYSDEVKQMVENIHGKNPFSRVTIYSCAYQFPLPDTVSDLQADGFINTVIRIEAYIKLAQRGHVGREEFRQRGKTVEDIVTGQRIEGRIGHWRSKER